MMPDLQCLRAFRTHSLQDVGEQSLLNRYDTKYLLPLQHLDTFLRMLHAEYSLLELGGRTLHRYRTDYFDTPGFDLYFSHHNGRCPRSKLRCRTYIDSNRRYLELKTRNNKGRTEKVRVAMDGDRHGADLRGLVSAPEFAAVSGLQLQQRVTVEYSRLSLWSARLDERLSIDLDLCARRQPGRTGFTLGELAVVEVKQSSRNRSSPALALLRHLNVRPQSFSKYCVACALLYPHTLRCNRFRRLLRQLNPFVTRHPFSLQEPCHAGF